MSVTDIVTDVQAYMVAQGLVDGSTGWPSVRRMEHDDTQRLVILTEDGGPAPEIGTNAGIGDGAFRDLGLQVRVRAAPHESDASYTKASAILSHFHGRLGLTVEGTRYFRIVSLTPLPVFIGFDENRRPSHTVSLRFLGGQPAP